MIRRCYDPTWHRFNRYGGRGIKVCDRWFNSFERFYDDMSPSYIKGLTLERIDNEKGYSPENCKWATMAENISNRFNSRPVEYKGKIGTITPMSRSLGLHFSNVMYHMDKGLTFEQAADFLLNKKKLKAINLQSKNKQ